MKMAKTTGKSGGSSKPTTVEVNKSAVTGRFVTDAYVKSHPKTTYVETVKKGGDKK